MIRLFSIVVSLISLVYVNCHLIYRLSYSIHLGSRVWEPNPLSYLTLNLKFCLKLNVKAPKTLVLWNYT